MRWMKRGLIAVAGFSGLMLLLVAAFMINDQIGKRRYEQFYVEHPMLRVMRDSSWTEMTSVLLQRVPVGTAQSDALQILSLEGLDCRPSRNSGDTRLMVCGTGKGGADRAWYIEVSFDAHDKVSSGRAMYFKASA